MKEFKSPQLFSGATPARVAEDISMLVNFELEGMPLDELESLLTDRLLPHLMRYDQPGFQSMFNAFPPPEAKLGAQVSLDYNQGVTNWQVSPGGAVLEELCCQALCKLFGLGPEADATFMYSGTYANQQALYMALHRQAEREGFDLAQKGIAGFDAPDRLAVLVSRDAHFSLKHAVRILGLGEESLVLLPVDLNRRVDLDVLQGVIREIGNSLDIFCMVATAGTTSTGSIDPIDEMGNLCADIGAWLHIDGAYGYAYKLVSEWSHLFTGDDRADSIIWDPHKQLGAPIPNSILFVKQKQGFSRMSLHSGYFNRPGDVMPNPGLKSPPSTRPMSALSLVTFLRGQGMGQVIQGLRSPLAIIRSLANYLNSQPDFEVLHQPDTGILCFRVTPEGILTPDLDRLQDQLYQQIMSSGKRSISITKLDGITALRLVVVNPKTIYGDLFETIVALRELASNII
jgi:L-2,4-diaminobutyrate decarboxylase